MVCTVYVYVLPLLICSCLDLMSRFMDLLEANPQVEFSTVIKDEEENFKATIYIHVVCVSPHPPPSLLVSFPPFECHHQPLII